MTKPSRPLPAHRFRQLSILLSAVLVAGVLLLAKISLAQAQEATPEPNPTTAVTPEETTQKLKERIEKIVEEKREQIKGTLDDLTKQKRGFIGEVERVSEETITVMTSKGTQILPIDENVVLLKKGQPIKTVDVAVGDWAIILGLIENDSFVPKKIIISSTSLRPKNHVVKIGSLQSIGKTSIGFLPRSSEEALTSTINKNTKYQDSAGKNAELSDFEENMQCLLIGYQDGDEIVVTTLRALAPFSKPTEE